MPQPEADEFAAWEHNHQGRIVGFQGKSDYHPLGWTARWLLPGLDQGFAEPGDLLVVARAPSLSSKDVGALGNATRGTLLKASVFRAALALALPAAIGLSLMRWIGASWPIAFAPVVLALVAVGRLLDAGKAAAGAVARLKAETDRKAAEHLAFMRRYMAPPPPPLSSEQREARLGAAYDERLAELRWEAVASLSLPDGRLIARDAFEIGVDKGRIIDVPPGTYKVHLGIVRLRPEQMLWGEERIAYAMLRLRDMPAARWEAVADAAGEPMTVPVDSATACFTSPSAAEALAAAFDPDGTGYGVEFEKALEPVYRQGWMVLETAGGPSVAFMSGFGDGSYPVRRALDADDRPVAIVLDFEVP